MLSSSTRRAAMLFAAACVATAAHAQAPSRAQAAALNVRKELSDSAVPAIAKSRLVSAVDAAETISVTVCLKPRSLAGLQAFCDSVSDPKSANYRHFISPEEVGNRFGASEADRAAVVDYLASKGVNVTLVAPNGMAILANGSAANLQNAFGAKLAYYKGVDPQSRAIVYRANATPLTVPAAISGVVSYVSGLENYTRPQKRATTTTLTPAQTSALYGIKPAMGLGFSGSGRNVAISNFDGFQLSNVPYFVSQFGLPTPAGGAGSNIAVVTVGTGAQSSSPQGEGDLDIQMVLGQAPLANIRVYDSTSDLIGVLTREATDNWADVITESWGWSGSATFYNNAHNQHLAMTAQGITYMAASGDSGTSLSGYPYPDFEPEVLQVGGTIATVDSTTGLRQSEIAWNYSGGGWYNSATTITFNTRPSWQKGTGVSTTVNRRLVPDISYHAAANNSSSFNPGGYYFAYGGTGSFVTGDGTSFASPVFAGALTTLEERLYQYEGRPTSNANRPRLGRLQDLIYSQNGRSDVYTDITSGTNGRLPGSSTGTSNTLNGATSNCTTGWDYVTGWGPLDLEGFYNSLFGGR